jgi:hypothetical protein
MSKIGTPVSPRALTCADGVVFGSAPRESAARVPHPWRRRLILVAAALLVLAGARVLFGAPGSLRAARPAAAARQLSRLPLAARGPVSDALGADDRQFWVRRASGGLAARNGAQGFKARFSRSGVTLAAGSRRLSLTLTGIGYAGGRLHGLAPMAQVASRNRVSYADRALSEWFMNGPLGLEQGFTLKAPPVGARRGPLTIALRLAGSLRARLVQRSQAVDFVAPGGGVVLRYAGLSVSDALGRALPARLDLAGDRLLIRVNGRGAVYPVRIDPLVQQGSKLTASDETGDGAFGDSVSLSSDGNTALVGGPADNGGVGAAWVFTRSGSTWTQEGSKLTASDETGDAGLGQSVALSSDGSTALVGGPSDNGSGAAWVFTLSSSTWSQQGPKLVGTGASAPSEQGWSVSLSSDGNTALVGGPDDDSDTGAAWVYTRSGSTWTQEGSELVGTGASGGAEQGWSVALSGDGSTALVGGYLDDTSAGAAWEFAVSGGTWTQQGLKLVGSGATTSTEPGAEQGWSVALSDDGTTALVGGPGDNGEAGPSAQDVGAVWVFVPPPAPVVAGTVVSNAGQTTSASFSSSVTVPAGVDVTGATCGFDYNGSTQSEVSAPCTVTAGASTQFGASVTDLPPGSTAGVNAYVNIGGTVYNGPTTYFTTQAPPPTLTTGAASNVGQTTATLNASVSINPVEDAFGDGAVCEFQYGTDPTLQTGVATVAATAIQPSGSCDQFTTSFSSTITGLTPGATYYYRAVIVSPNVLPAPAYGSIVSFTTASSVQPGPTPAPPSGPPGPGPAPTTPSTGSLSPTTCTMQTRSITAAGGSLEVTGCMYGDNEGQYLIEGQFTFNGLTVTADSGPQGYPATFSCTTTDSACNALLQTYTSATKPEFIIDVPDLKVGANAKYTLATGSTTLFDGKLQSPGETWAGATFDPAVTGQPTGSPPAIYLAPGTGSHVGDLHGLPIEGPVTIIPQPTGGAEVMLTLALPFKNITGTTTLYVSPTGAEDLRQLALDVPNLTIPGTEIEIGHVGFSFNLDTGEWSATATLPIPGINYKLTVSITMTGDSLTNFGGGADNIDWEVPGTEGALTLDAVQLSVGISPLMLGGTLTFSGGPQIDHKAALEIAGNFNIAFNAPAAIGPISNIVPTMTYPNVPVAINISGDLTLVKGLPLSFTLGSATLNMLLGSDSGSGFDFDALLTFSGGLGPLGPSGCAPTQCEPQGLDLAVDGTTLASVHATLDGVATVPIGGGAPDFDADAYGSLSLLGLPGLTGEVLVSKTGFAACANIGDALEALLGTRRVAPPASAGGPAAQAFAASVAAGAHPLALSRLSAAHKQKRVKQVTADLQQTLASARKLARTTKHDVATIVAADRHQSRHDAAAAVTGIRATARGYTDGTMTGGQVAGKLLTDASADAGALQAAGTTADDQLAALRQSTTSTLQSLLQRAEGDEAQLHVLESGAGGAAADPIATQACNPFSSSCWDSIGSTLQSVGNTILSGLESGGDATANAGSSAASSVTSAFTAAGDAIGQAAASVAGQVGTALATFTTEMSTFAADALALSDQIGDQLKQFGKLVASSLVNVYEDLSQYLNGEVGIGDDWGQVPTIYPTGGCDASNFADVIPLPASTADTASRSAAVRAHAAAASSFSLKSGPQYVVLKFAGAGAPPLVDVQGPGGLMLTTPTSADAKLEDNGHAIVLRDPTSNTTFVELTPQTGTYTGTMQPGSAEVTSSSEATALPEPTITASVSGHGTRRVLHWHATTVPGQTLTFAVAAPSGTRTLATTAAAKGSMPFTVAAGLAGLGAVTAHVEQNGFSQEGFQVATFQAPVAAPPAAPRRLSIRRAGDSIHIAWRADGATVSSYTVQVATSGGLKDVVPVAAPSLTLGGILPADTVTAQVIAVGTEGQRSAPAVGSLAGHTESGCRAPRDVTIILHARGELSSVYATLNGKPVAESRTGARTLVVPLAGVITKRAALVVQGRTRRGRTVRARHVFVMCSGLIGKRLKLSLR